MLLSFNKLNFNLFQRLYYDNGPYSFLDINMNQRKHSDDLQGNCNQKYSFAWTVISLEHSGGLHASCHLCHTSVTVTRHTGRVDVCHSNEFCCCMDQEAEAWIKVSSLWDPKGPRWGGRSHTQKHGTHGARTSGWLSCCFHDDSYGAAFLLINWIPLINKPAVFVLLFTVRDLYLPPRLLWY